MISLKQSLRRIPYWAYLLLLIVISVNTIYIIYRYQGAVSGETAEPVNGPWIINYIRENSPFDRAKIRLGDTMVSCNGYPIAEWVSSYHGQKRGDTLSIGILRNNREVRIPVITDSKMSVFPALYWSVYIAMVLFSIGSLFLLVKKGQDKAARLFFMYIQLSAVAVIATNLPFPEFVFAFANVAYIFSSCLLGPVLIHFHLLFPRPVQPIRLIRFIPALFYILGLLIFIYSTISYYYHYNPLSKHRETLFNLIDRIALFWMTLTFLLALVIVIYQFLTVKNALSRNQMMIVFTGSFFGFLTPILHGLFYDYVNYMVSERQYLLPLLQGIGSFIMIVCILIAIFRYRIWDVEVIIRKVLLYIGATLVIMLTYLFMIWIVDSFTIRETNLTRFLILGISVIVFLLLRDQLQRLIDRIFQRESYDSATMVSDFEAKLAGIYRFDELKQKIVHSIDEIFHFKSFIFTLKKKELIYEPAFVYGTFKPVTGSEYEITRELEEKLQKAKVFSPEELSKKPTIFEETNGELVVPMVSEGQPNGFFICGQKKSERIYSRQDINVLTLLARRVVALLHTAELYQKDLDRQLMLERERARISQDMHDDVGASLTRISMMSDHVRNRTDIGTGASQWLGKISDTSRGLMEEMNQIIWALNPKNDNIEGLVTYIRRFAFEYLEPTAVSCVFDLPEEMPDRALSVEVRRNIYLVAREAIHNVVKHAGATKVLINLEMNEHRFRIKIKDDGKGFDPDRLEYPGNGLINMKKRMNDIGGEFNINPIPGKGTEVELVVGTILAK